MYLETETVCGLSWKGVLAYVAINVTGDGLWTTAHLAAAVGVRTEVMRAGLDEIVMSNLVARGPKRNWVVGKQLAGLMLASQVQKVDTRRKDFIDDLKIMWDWANPTMPFTMSASDGNAVNQFLKQYSAWDQETWRTALRNRFRSEVNKAQSPHRWLSRLGEYINGPIDRYGKPMRHGIGGKLGQTLETEAGNRAARQAVTEANRI